MFLNKSSHKISYANDSILFANSQIKEVTNVNRKNQFL
nr:MAG TPA: hypothetical protein [Bacteriophage sp.]